jgi:exonuclease SbcD
VKVLHTSDWHLGRMLENVPLVEHQRDFLSWLVTVSRDHEVEAIVVGGDVYDRAIPSVDAVQLFASALAHLVQICPLVLIAGNHDSPTRLGFGADLLATVHVHLRSFVDDVGKPVQLIGADGVEVLIYGIPFLEPQLARTPLGAEKSHEAVLSAAMDLVRTDLQARRTTPSAHDQPRAIVLSHSFVRGGLASESERDVSVGGVADVPASVFHGVDYVALGHLHRPQAIANGDGPVVRYSGSPLAYSFSEEDHAKSVAIVDVPADGPVTVVVLPCPVPRRLKTIVGDLDHLLSEPDLSAVEDCWIRAIVTDARQPDSAMDRLRTRFPHTIKLSWQPHVDGVPLQALDRRVDPATATPVDVVLGFIEHVTSLPPRDEDITLVEAAIERVRIAQVSA